MKYIIFSHLLNNYTGSPKVLKEVILTMQSSGRKVELYVGNKDGEGFLSDLDLRYTTSFYRFQENKLLRLLYLFGAEMALCFQVLFKVQKKECALIYANTLYSFGVAIAAKVKGIPVVYHIHETSLQPPILKRFLRFVVKYTSSLNIYVSDYHAQVESVEGVPSSTVYNSIDAQLFNTAIVSPYTFSFSFKVLMVCSLKAYKGLFEFLAIARQTPDVLYQLVINAERSEIDTFFEGTVLPINIELFSSQSDLVPFYTQASLLLNLSHPDRWIETFGLTLLEAMCFGIPVIAPPVGGPTELVDDGVSGYLVSAYETDRIVKIINTLSQDEALCMRLSSAAREKALLFSPQVFKSSLLSLINE